MEIKKPSYVAQLLYQIAQELGKPASSVEQYIQAFADEWIQSKEDLMEQSDADMEKFKLPLRLRQMMKQKLLGSQETQTLQPRAEVSKQMNEEVSQPSKSQLQRPPESMQMEQEKMVVQEQPPTDPLDELLTQIKRQAITNEKVLAAFQTLSKILGNIINFPDEEKYRKIKITSKTISENLAIYPDAMQLLAMCKFKPDNEHMILSKADFDKMLFLKLFQKIQAIIESTQASHFNPYQATYFGMQGISNADLAQKDGFISFYEQLEHLKQQRDKLMSEPVKDRETKYYKEVASKQSQQEYDNFQITDEQEQEREGSDQCTQAFKAQIMKLKESMEEQHFSSKRKMEYEKLLNAPVYTETRLKIKFPGNFVLEAKFSPKETILNVIDYIQSLLVDKQLQWYLFMTPPVTKMTKQYHFHTLLDLDCVPCAIFYFGLVDANSKLDHIDLKIQ